MNFLTSLFVAAVLLGALLVLPPAVRADSAGDLAASRWCVAGADGIVEEVMEFSANGEYRQAVGSPGIGHWQLRESFLSIEMDGTTTLFQFELKEGRLALSDGTVATHCGG